MELKLSTHGKTFATRELARAVTETARGGDGEVIVDAEGAYLSPSFTAELLGVLTERFDRVAVIGLEASRLEMVNRLANQLGLSSVVTTKATAAV